jgi:NAD(P)H-dependent FMN reductase
MTKIKVIVGSIRENRFGGKALPWVKEQLSKYALAHTDAQDKLEIEILDLKEWDLPLFAEPVSPKFIKDGNYRLPVVKNWAEKIKEADGFIFLTPEYNHGMSAALKNSLDYLYNEWMFKPMGIVSYGEVGGANMIQVLRLTAIELHMLPVKQAVHIMDPWTLKDSEGNLIPGSLEKYNGQFEEMMKDLMYLCGKMK